MAEHAGYDQPGDPFTNMNDGYPMDTSNSPPFQPKTGFTQHELNETTVVVGQQPQPGVMIINASPPDYMFPSILACIFCFFPTGICAIFYAHEAKNLAGAGDYDGATRMSNKARILMITSVILGILTAAIYVLLRFLVFN